jgi:hypothetical protein
MAKPLSILVLSIPTSTTTTTTTAPPQPDGLGIGAEVGLIIVAIYFGYKEIRRHRQRQP